LSGIKNLAFYVNKSGFNAFKVLFISKKVHSSSIVAIKTHRNPLFFYRIQCIIAGNEALLFNTK
jgi:hypothetical protein